MTTRYSVYYDTWTNLGPCLPSSPSIPSAPNALRQRGANTPGMEQRANPALGCGCMAPHSRRSDNRPGPAFPLVVDITVSRRSVLGSIGRGLYHENPCTEVLTFQWSEWLARHALANSGVVARPAIDHLLVL